MACRNFDEGLLKKITISVGVGMHARKQKLGQEHDN